MCTPVTPAVPYLLLGLQDIQWAVGNSRGARKLARTPHVNQKKKKWGLGMSGDPKNNGWILQETNVSYIHCHHPGKSKQLYVADKVKFTLGRRQNNITRYISWEFVLKQMPLRSRDIRPLFFSCHILLARGTAAGILSSHHRIQ